jgi:hypothetical protein
MRLALAFLYLLGVFFLSSGCRDYDPPYFYETVSMTLSNADNSGNSPVSAGDSVNKYAYAIQLNLTMEPRSHEGADSYESDFVNEDNVNELSITCSQTFNGLVPNQSLNHLFNTSRFNELTAPYTGLFSGPSPGSDVPDSWNSKNYLLLMVPPDSSGVYTFHVSATFSDGRTLADSVTVNLYE